MHESASGEVDDGYDDDEDDKMIDDGDDDGEREGPCQCACQELLQPIAGAGHTYFHVEDCIIDVTLPHDQMGKRDREMETLIYRLRK
ncbi:hypothetical protein TWF281_001249 [Arthrobotrys megalospora]